jgi:uncharacterized membrane protein
MYRAKNLALMDMRGEPFVLMHLSRRTLWSLMLLLSFVIVLYAGAMLATRAFPDELRPSFNVHSFAISLHIVGATLPLALGPFQFLPRLRNRYRNVHRWSGRLYLLGVFAGGTSGLYLAFFSFGGINTHLAFGSLAVLWLATGVLAYRAIRAGRIEEHRQWMTRNFALTFAGVMLRLWMPVSVIGGIPFDTAYVVVAWLCWVPNLIVAEVFFNSARRRMVPVSSEATTA